MSKKTKQDLLEMLEMLAEEKLQPPSFDELLKVSVALKEEEIDTRDLYNMEVESFDEDGAENYVIVEHKAITNVTKEVDALKERLDEASTIIENNATELWNQASGEVWYWVGKLDKGLNWSTREWMNSAFKHGPSTLSNWIQGIVKHGDLSLGPEYWTQEYRECAKDNREKLNWGIWTQALSSHCSLMKDERATAWLKHLIDLAQDETWMVAEVNLKSWKRLEWVPAQEKIKDYIDRLVSSRAFIDALNSRKQFWNVLLERRPFEFADAHLPAFFFENRKETDPARFQSWAETLKEKLIQLKAEHLWNAPIPENRPALPEKWMSWEKLMGWWRECESTGTLGWHAIRDGLSRQVHATPEMKAWIEKMDLDLHLPTSSSSTPSSKLRL